MAARFNKPGHTLFDHRTWVIASDGDIMEGVASEAASIAGHLKLGKLTSSGTITRSRSTAGRT